MFVFFKDLFNLILYLLYIIIQTPFKVYSTLLLNKIRFIYFSFPFFLHTLFITFLAATYYILPLPHFMTTGCTNKSH